MQITNDEFIPGHDPAYLAPVKPFIPWSMVEDAVKADTSLPNLDLAVAQKLVAERELAYKYNEGYEE